MDVDLGNLPSFLRWGVILGLSVLAAGIAIEHFSGNSLIREAGLFLIVLTPASFLVALSYRMFTEGEYKIAVLSLLTLSVVVISALLSLS
ncbi:MAG: hypothetical protein QI197_07430 [Candidatus Korarchaeota archaeon]|nr:hypothetical protein [Candidatus Korarchaeota archaeon]